MADGKKPQTTKAIAAQRVEELLRIRLDGAEFWDAREYVREKEQEEGSAWQLPQDAKPLSDSQIFRYLARVDKLIAESCRASRRKLLRRHLAQRRNLFAKAVSQGDIRVALACIADEAKLLGLYAPQKIAPTNPAGDRPYDALTDEARVAALAAILTTVGGAGGGPPSGETGDADGLPLGGSVEDPDRGGDDPGPLAGGVDEGELDAGAFAL